MDTLPKNMTEEEFQRQIQFALFLQYSFNSAGCIASPDYFNNDAETIIRFLTEIKEGVNSTSST